MKANRGDLDIDNISMLQTVCIYQTLDTIGYATRPLWQKIYQTTNALRILLCELDDEDLDAIDELNLVNPCECAKALMRALDANPNTRYMS